MDFTLYAPLDAATIPDQTSTPAEGIEAIAARIHDRAKQLALEQEALRSAKEELSIAEKDLVKELDLRQRVRMEFLKCLSNSTNIELECIQIQEQIKNRISSTKKIEEKGEEIVSQVSIKESEWAVTEESITRHKLCQDMYLKILRTVINKRNQACSRRRSRMETVVQLCEATKRSEETIIVDQNRIRNDILRSTQVEKDENDAVENLASQVREAIAKRSELRSLLRETQQKYHDARTEVDRIGYEYRSSSF